MIGATEQCPPIWFLEIQLAMVPADHGLVMCMHMLQFCMVAPAMYSHIQLKHVMFTVTGACIAVLVAATDFFLHHTWLPRSSPKGWSLVGWQDLVQPLWVLDDS